jgi:hypothetical protein
MIVTLDRSRGPGTAAPFLATRRQHPAWGRRSVRYLILGFALQKTHRRAAHAHRLHVTQPLFQLGNELCAGASSCTRSVRFPLQIRPCRGFCIPWSWSVSGLKAA